MEGSPELARFLETLRWMLLRQGKKLERFILKLVVELFGLLGLSNEAGVTFDNSFFDNYFDFLRQLKNGSLLGPVFIHVTGRSKN